jgi:hypothetical protein
MDYTGTFNYSKCSTKALTMLEDKLVMRLIYDLLNLKEKKLENNM